ncbi:SDR family oxidoreductase [Gordonia paraffinivorans]|uniref:SDR family oxidoreductase n=1 Tax=Gordonia paraffinivorans TaxID=175628 RepID=UPI001C92D6BA|nr:SDR family oxidoreductase [Gordonia paraffinivorans]
MTGGGSGIGRCTAHELAHLGANVVIVGRNPERLENVAAEIQEDGGIVAPFVCDIRDEDRVKEVVTAVVERFGGIHGLVNNAGGQYKSPLEEISTKGFEAVVRNNLTGGFLFMREVFNGYMKEHGGSIVNIIADIWHGWPGFAHSGAARGGMLTLSESAAGEWAEHGVRVNALAPGSIASSGLDTYPEHQRSYIRESVIPRQPLRRFGSESEISAGIVYLLSPAAAFTTGTCLRIDGAAPNGRRWGLNGSNNNETYNGFHRAQRPKILEGTD